MKSSEVYALLRSEIAPWAKAQSFKRAKPVLWTRQHGDTQTSFWLQIAVQDSWDPYAGSMFTVNFTHGSLPPRPFDRIGRLLDNEGLERLRVIQDSVISSLSRPPADYDKLHVSQQVTDWYLAKFNPIEQAYSGTEDIWLRYHEPEHVQAWGRFIVDVLPSCIQRIEHGG